ncbi:MAG: hypothetical protein Q8W49_01355 [Candidatus Palauibacterales bacterium]|nr:hypothetical protein [Candidatus Palauibacterales bacterium]MDP2584337.1 hypothetical protein [Candidatus Palauibacterales bacterium]
MIQAFRRLTRGRFGRLVLPAVVLQSVLVGGGYATGRESVAYGARYGGRGWMAVLTIFVGFTVVSFLTFEIARRYRTYEYKAFIRQLIGRAWPAFDLVYVAMAILVIAVVASAAANILQETLGLPSILGAALVILAVASLLYFGADVIEAFKSLGTILLYVAYLLFGALVLGNRWPDVVRALSGGGAGTVAHGGVVAGVVASSAGAPTLAVVGTGIVYVGYNLAVYPAVLFTLHRQTERRETAVAALLSGFLMTLPFALTWLCLLAFYPSAEVFDAPVPWLHMLQDVGGTALFALFGIVMGWTLLETSVGLIHALVDRIDADLRHASPDPPGRTGREGEAAEPGGLSPAASGLLGGGILLVAAVLSRVGIIALVARGYTWMGYAFIAVFALPLLTVGVWKTLGPGGRVPAVTARSVESGATGESAGSRVD